MRKARPRDLPRPTLGVRGGRPGQVVERAIELRVGPRRVSRFEALVELLGAEPPGRRVLAEGPRDALAIGVGGADGSLGLVHLPDARSPWPARC